MNTENLKNMKSAEEAIEKMRQGIVITDQNVLMTLRSFPDINGNMSEFVYKEYTNNSYADIERVDKWIKETNRQLPYLPLSLEDAYAELKAGHYIYEDEQQLKTMLIRKSNKDTETCYVMFRHTGFGSWSVCCPLEEFKEVFATSSYVFLRCPDEEGED